MNEKKEVGADFVRRVMSMVESLRRYTTSPDFDGKYKKVLEQIDALPDTKEKKEARATALMFASWKSGEISAEERQYIEENKPAKWKVDEYIDRYISAGNGKAEDDILAEGLQKARDLGEKDGEGEIRFWMARRLIEKKEYANAATEFEHAAALLSHENSYYPNAIAGARIAGKLAAQDTDSTIQAGYAACGEMVHFDSEHAYFVSQPGFNGGAYTAQAAFNSIFYFASRVSHLFYDTTLAVGESIVDGNGNLFTCISRDRTVETPAGVFENCVEYFCDVKKGHGDWVFTAETVYKEGVGLVSIHVKNSGSDETYVLTDFEIKGGTGLMPFAVGNRWRYTNPALPSHITCDTLREVMFCCEDYAGIAATQFITHDSELEKYVDADAAAYIDRGDMFCNELKFREPYDAEKVAAACQAFCRAMQLATTERDAILAEAALAHLDKRAGYVRTGYRLLPSSVHLDSITRDGEKITYAEEYYVSPFYIHGRRMIDNKIFGTKIFRWLGEICGTPFDPRWMAALESDEGFTETRTDENGDEVRITARRGGTVATKAGIFQNCIALTIEKGDQDGKFAYYWQPQYRNVGRGRKTYYFAPDVGIVKLECKWGETLSSVCELASYKSVSTSGEYMPFYYGMEWHYEEVTLREKYIA